MFTDQPAYLTCDFSSRSQPIDPLLLQQLYRPDRSPPAFHDQFSNTPSTQEHQQRAPNLQGDGLAWPINYLAEVRHCVALPHSSFKPAQALDDPDPPSSTSRNYLRELGNLRGTRAILPTSWHAERFKHLQRCR